MDQNPSAVRFPLHSDVSLLAERRREFLCETHRKAPQARRVSLPPGTQRCHPPLPRRHQCKPNALYLDQGPQQNHRRRQARVPSVRFDPLGTTDQCNECRFVLHRLPKGSDPMPQTLREEINDVVTRYLELNLQTSASVDVAAMAREIAQSFVDMVMEQEERQHAPLLAQMITT